MEHCKFFNFELLDEIQFIKNQKGVCYGNVECAFDIETTSTTYQGEKFAFMYIWQFGIGKDNPVYYGRTWEEFLNLISSISNYLGLNSNKILPVYVHNLSYEFQFIRKHFNWEHVFALNERKVAKALTSEFFEFRDSYVLSGFSLALTAKNLTKYKVEKLIGDLDYNLVRHEETPLTEKEMGYCENDIRVVNSYIKEQIEICGDINKLPMTNTGRVRKFVKNNCYFSNKNHSKSSKGKYFRYRKIMGDLTLEPDDYIQLKRAFMGGYTHSNPLYTGATLKNVDSVDLTSSYPTVMCAEKFPMSRPKEVEVKSIEELENLFLKHCVIFDVKFKNLDNKLGYESYISESKCWNVKKPIINNGRIFSCEELSTTIVDVDFKIIKQNYSWDSIEIRNVKKFRKNYLPKSIIESILNLYQEKTVLKDVEGYETEYLLSKGMLNSIYGMCVTDIVKDEHLYDCDEWKVEKVDLEHKISEYNSSKNRFLYYPWGIWVTAYARKNLWELILNVDNDYIYSDTDSVKMLNYENHLKYIEHYNEKILLKLEKMCEHYNFNKELLTPKTKQGKLKPLGIWDYEGHYDNFKTLGAKRYMLQTGDNYQITVAGLSKQNGVKYLREISNNESEKIFSNFDDNLYVPSGKTGKMTHTYLDFESNAIIKDYKGNMKEVNSLSGIHLEPCEFTLSINKTYAKFLEEMNKGYIFKGVKHV